MEGKIGQIMEFASCDRATAQRLYEQNDGNLEKAVDAFLSNPSMGSIEPQYAPPSTQPPQVSWDDPPPPAQNPAQGGASSNQEQKLIQAGPTTGSGQVWEDHANKEGRRRSPRNHSAKRRGSPVDLTADDDDEDLRKAMQASLETENDRQKRQQYGPARAPGQTANEEEEQLTRAIEASMLQSSAATRPQSPILPEAQLNQLGAAALREPEQPQAILPPSPFMHLFAAALQAMYASESLRKAFMSLRLGDIRIDPMVVEKDAMKEYWKGGSPSGLRKPTSEQWALSNADKAIQDKYDVMMRLSTLLVFMTFSKRQVCVAEDVISNSPVKGNYAYTMNSERKPAEQIIACYIENSLSALADMLANAQTRGLENAPDMDEALGTFTTHTLNAQKPGEEQNSQMTTDPYDFSVHHLQRNAINTNVHRALYSRHAEEGTLYQKLGKTLLFSIGNMRATPLGFISSWDAERDEAAPFSIETSIYMDCFMHAKRKGERLDLDTERVKQAHDIVEKLEKYKRTISTQGGEDSRQLLRKSIAYFRETCRDDGTDPVRTANIAEAVPRLEAILDKLEKEIASTEESLASARLNTDKLRDSKLVAFEQDLAKPENQTMRYDLTATIRTSNDVSWVHVRHRDETRQSQDEAQWWRIADGAAQLSTVEDATDTAEAPIFLIYTVHEEEGDMVRPRSKSMSTSSSIDGEDSMDRDDKPAKNIRLDTERNAWADSAVVEAIEFDNIELIQHLSGQNLAASADRVMGPVTGPNAPLSPTSGTAPDVGMSG